MAEVRVNLRTVQSGTDEIAQLKRDVQAIKSKTIQIKATDSGIDEAVSDLAKIEDKAVRIGATDVGIDEAVSGLAGITDKDIQIKATDSGIDEAVSDLALVTDKSVQISATDSGIDEAVSSLAAITDKNVKVTATLDDSQVQGFLTQLQSGFQMPGMGGGPGGGMLGGLLGKMGPLGMGAAALMAATTWVVGQAGELDKMTDYAAASLKIKEGTGKRERLETLTTDLGKGESRFNVFEITAVADMLGRNGITLEALEMGILEQTLTLSEGLASLGEDPASIAPQAADLITDALKQFNITDLSMLSHYGDMMAGFTQESKGTISDLSYLFAQGGGVAGQMGMSLDDFITLGTGIMPYFSGGSDAGTSMKSMLNRIASPSGPAKDTLMELGLWDFDWDTHQKNIASFEGGEISKEEFSELQAANEGRSFFFDESGMMREMVDVIADMQEALGDLTDAQRGMALSDIFGTDAMRAAGAMLGFGDTGYQDLMLELQNTSVEELKEIKDLNTAAEWQKMTGKLQTLAADIASPLDDALQGILRAGNQTLDYWLSDDKGKEELKKDAAVGRAEDAWQGEMDRNMALYEGAVARGMSEERMTEVFGANLEMIYTAADAAFQKSLTGEDAPGWFNFNQLFDDAEIEEAAVSSLATLRAAWDTENPRVTVEVEYVAVNDPMTAYPGGSRANPKTGEGSRSGRTVQPDRRQESTRKTQTESNRGRIGTNGGLVLDLSAVN